jgi:hypothetical protein
MDKLAAYLVSIRIIGIGFWIFAVAKNGVWLAGLAPVVIGLANLFGEIQNDSATAFFCRARGRPWMRLRT